MKQTLRNKLEFLLNDYKRCKNIARENMHKASLCANWEKARQYDEQAKNYDQSIKDLIEVLK